MSEQNKWVRGWLIRVVAFLSFLCVVNMLPLWLVLATSVVGAIEFIVFNSQVHSIELEEKPKRKRKRKPLFQDWLRELAIFDIALNNLTNDKPKRKPDYSPCLFENEQCDHAIYCKAIIVDDVLEGCEYPKQKRKNKPIIWADEHQRTIAFLREEWNRALADTKPLSMRELEDTNRKYFDGVKKAKREHQQELEDIRKYHSVPKVHENPGWTTVTK